mmetsp:Transcript_23358/g.53859  ORF Transcript_23358/g.53859 Transcript_23358/m.53859 type:complete len:259 (+) Transcript_23358:71-847(+)
MEYTQPPDRGEVLEIDGEAVQQRDGLHLHKVDAQIRLGFVRKVYGILTIQLLLTVATASYLYTCHKDLFRGREGHQLTKLSVFIYIGIACVADCCPHVLRRFPVNYMLLGVITGAISVIVAAVSIAHRWESVILAAGLTAALVLCLTAYACCTKRDFTGYTPYLAVAMMALCLSLCCFIGLKAYGIEVELALYLIDCGFVLLFGCGVVFDTQLILGEYWGHAKQFQVDDYCLGAIQLYLDIIQLFLFILRLMGQRDDD